MNIFRYYRAKGYRFIAVAQTSGVVGVMTEPLFLSIYLFRQILRGNLVKRKFLLFYMALLVHGLIMNVLTGYTMTKMFQQLLLLFIVQFGYIQLYNKTGKSLSDWFCVYLNLAYVVSLIGIVQLAIFLLFGVNLIPYTMDFLPTQNSLRLHSVFLEAGHVALYFVPAVSYIILSKDFMKCNKKQSVLILFAAICTLSSSMYVAIAIALMIRLFSYFRRLKVFLYVCVFVFIFQMSTNSSDERQFDHQNQVSYENAIAKVTESMTALSTLMSKDCSPDLFENFNGSTYATMTNAWVALNAPYRLVGTGIGTHQQNYEAMYTSDYYLYGLNKEDAYSLFFRLLSEFGVIGLSFYIWYLKKSYNRHNLLSLCFLLFIISALIKGGHYTMNCAMLFQFLYYQCSKEVCEESKINKCLNLKRKRICPN